MTDILSNMDRDFGDMTPGLADGVTSEENTNTNDVYEPRRSARVNANTSGDGDSWQEKLMVCEAAGNKLVIRSYFRSSKSGQRVWDEPPTGASHVEAASAADRQKAEEELKNLQLAMDINSTPQPEDDKSKSSKKSKGLFSAFRRKPKDKSKGSSAGLFGKKKKDNNASKASTNRPRAAANDVDANEDLQRAISLSMGLNPGDGKDNASGTGINATNSWQAEDEALEMAKAMSISEAEAAKPPATHNYTEDEMLQRAIEESQRQTPEVASMPAKGADVFGFMEDQSESFHGQQSAKMQFSDDSDFLNQKMPATNTKADYDDDLFNQKMPAQPSAKMPPSSASNAYAMFDPYANNNNSPPAAAAATVANNSSAKAPPRSPPSGGKSENRDSQGLRKMDSPEGRRSSGMGLGRRFNKKNVEDEAGIV